MTHAHPPRAREFTGKHMLLVMIAFFGTIIAVNAALAVLANRTWSGLIVKNGYVASQAFNADHRRRLAQEKLGWRATVAHANGRLSLAFKRADGSAIAGLSVTGKLGRPVTDREDIALTFVGDGAGRYSADATPKAGVWGLEVSAFDGSGTTFVQTYRFVVTGE
jgi:nitrogen fixation protein FixH